MDDDSFRIPSYRFEVDEAANNDLRVAFKQHCDKKIHHKLLFERDSESFNILMFFAAPQAEQEEKSGEVHQKYNCKSPQVVEE